MMKVLSIDFDWVMEPCIEAYNSLSLQSVLGPFETWEYIDNIIPDMSAMAQMDCNKFADLYFFIREMAKSNLDTPIIVAADHEQIIDGLYHQPKFMKESLEIINIDHHHDLGYKDDDQEFSERAYNCSNWAYYLSKHAPYRFTNYTWVGNKNSKTVLKHPIPGWMTYTKSTDLFMIDPNQKFDFIFICSSFDWVPLKYRRMFNILVSEPGKAGLK